MFVILESASFKQKGFMSLFKTYTFACRILIDNKPKAVLNLKAKNGFIGYVFELPSATQKLGLQVVCKEIKQTYDVKLAIVRQEIKINNEKFKGVIRLAVTNHGSFAELENRQLVKLGCEPIELHSYLAKPNKSWFTIRQTYYGANYYVDLLAQKMMWDKKSEIIAENLPAGWATGVTDNGQVFYINHNKNYTQWENPFDRKYAIDLESRMLQYKLNVEGINILNFLDFARFKIEAKRFYAIQSTAKSLLNAKREDLTKQPIVVFEDEIGEDYGAIIREFFHVASLEFAKDERLKSLGVVFDVKTEEERALDKDCKDEYDRHNHETTFIDEDLRRTQEVNRNSPNILESFFNLHATPRPNGEDNNHFRNLLISNISPIYDTTESSFYGEENTGKNNLCDRDFYTYLGIFIGMAFDHEINIAIDFSLAFYENLMDRNFNITMVQDLQMQSSLSYILTNNIENDDIIDENGNKVTEETKSVYVENMVKYVLFGSKEREYDWIREGFYRIAIPCVTSFFSAKDIANMLIGNEELTFEMIKNAVLFLYCTNSDKEVQYLWNVLQRQDESFLRRFLQFLTGSASIPMGGLRGNRFKWYLEVVNDNNSFIRASACINKLFIGTYDDEETFERYFMYSINNTEGFHKV